MSFISSFFSNVSENVDLSKENKELKKENERLEKARKVDARFHEAEMYRKDRDLERAREEFEHERKRDRERHAERETYLTKRADEAEEKADRRAEQELQAQLKDARLAIHEEYSTDMDDLRASVHVETSRADAAEARIEELRTTVQSLQQQLNENREFVQFALTKLPNVDLSKFNVNVDVPPAQVNVTGGKKN